KAPAEVSSMPGFLEKVLLEARVFLVPGEVFGSNGHRFARSSLCQPVEVLQQALLQIQDWKKSCP
ncbi:MAG: aminotransferase, partial [Pseudobdellovibrionaceae bacterium]